MLKWVFGADTGPFRQGLGSMRNDVKSFGGSIKSMLAGAFAVGTAMSILDEAGRIDDLSKRLDMSAESMQRIGFAAKLSGSDVELAAKGLTVFARNLTQAERGSTAFDEAAKTLSLSLQQMRDLSPEEQLVEISRGYTEAADKGQALTAVIELMGKSGAELIPLFAEGPDVLREKMEEAQVATDAQIATMAELGDQIDKVKGVALKLAGAIIDGFKTAGAYVAWMLDKIYDPGNADELLGNALDRIVNGDRSNQEAKANAEAMKETAEQIKKTAEDRQKLEESIAKLEEDAAMARLSTEEKINTLKREQAGLAADSIFLNGNDALEAREKQLEIEKRILDLQKQQQDEARSAAEQIAQQSQQIADAVKAEAEVEKNNRRAAMSDEEKIADMRKEQAELIRQSQEAQKARQYLEAIQKRTEAERIEGEIAVMQRGKFVAPTIIADDMRKIGGGGRAVATMMNPNAGVEQRQDTMINILRSIDNKTKGGKSADPAF